MITKYKQLGYSTITITDHYNEKLLINRSPSDVVEHFLEGYHNAILKGKEVGMNIILGMEIRFSNEKEDYLVYGINEKFLLKYYDICKTNIVYLRNILKKENLKFFIVQAHPGRTCCKYPSQLDGIEVYNAMNKNKMMNDYALIYANKYDLFKTSGTDCHNDNILGIGGIGTKHEITNSDELIQTFRSFNHYDLINNIDIKM